MEFFYDADDSSLDNYKISVYSDHTCTQCSLFLQSKLMKIYDKFSDEVTKKFNFSKSGLNGS